MSQAYSILGTCRSGTTALFRALVDHSDVFGVFQPVKEGQRKDLGPDYSIYEGDHSVLYGADKPVVFFKETVGHSTDADCTLPVFRSERDLETTKPCFLFRDPVSTYNSWKKFGWGSPENFITSFETVFSYVETAKRIGAPHVVLTHNSLIKDPKKAFNKIAALWGIKDPKPFTEPFRHSFDKTHPNVCFVLDPDEHVEALSAVSTTTQLAPQKTGEDRVTNGERAKIEGALSQLYDQIVRAEQEAHATGPETPHEDPPIRFPMAIFEPDDPKRS